MPSSRTHVRSSSRVNSSTQSRHKKPNEQRRWENHDAPRFQASLLDDDDEAGGGTRKEKFTDDLLPTLEQRRWLLRRGFDPTNVKGRCGRREVTAMHKAAREGDLRTAEWLMSCGVSSQAKDVDGNSPSHYACREGQVEMQRFLEGTAGGATASFEANKLGVVPVSMLVDSQERKRHAEARAEAREEQKHRIHKPERTGRRRGGHRGGGSSSSSDGRGTINVRPDEVLQGADRAFCAILLLDPTQQKVAAREFCDSIRRDRQRRGPSAT